MLRQHSLSCRFTTHPLRRGLCPGQYRPAEPQEWLPELSEKLFATVFMQSPQLLQQLRKSAMVKSMLAKGLKIASQLVIAERNWQLVTPDPGNLTGKAVLGGNVSKLMDSIGLVCTQ